MTAIVARPPSNAIGRACLRTCDGEVVATSAHRWFEPADAVDEEVLRLASPPVLDVGCGPARHTVALVRRGVLAMGLDVSDAAVQHAVLRGAPVLRRSVFGPVPGERAWGTVLLLDGNVGIGADPAALLMRTRELLRPDGVALVESEGPDVEVEPLLVAVEERGRLGDWFPWARVGVHRLVAIAVAAGFDVGDVWSRKGRWFARLDAR